ncbi:hypothetical protein [Acidithiobacillus sp. HP-11]|uniref:hypothetical protein n=1 Tax=Acidithiobacillus sp. HP-11 TaxID=2697656 RepID=UPI00187A3F20|nr:hypothetical protein [Acidithiobacillus sp. HP-11]MBE7567256.1 hypothetical protein [Acidithiobacillus sp. HP-11]
MNTLESTYPDTFPNMVTILLSKAQDMLGQRLPKDAIIHLPYCWHDVPGTSDLILLNRLYKPIGVTCYGAKVEGRLTYPGESVNYADFPELMAPRGSVHDVENMLCNSIPNPRRWFFNDTNAPWDGKQNTQRLADLIQSNLYALDDLAWF